MADIEPSTPEHETRNPKPNVRIAVLLPTLNEAANIESVITEVRVTVPEAEIVVIDGLSKDKTIEIAKRLGATVLMETRKGKGFAIMTAFEKVDADYIFMIDADLTYPVKEIPHFLELLQSQKADVVMGSRLTGNLEAGSMPLVNNIGNRMICLTASVLYLKWVNDVCTGMWGFNRKAYKSIIVKAHTFELECNLFAQAVKKGLKIIEVPISYARRGGESKVQLIDGVKDCWFLLKERLQR